MGEFGPDLLLVEIQSFDLLSQRPRRRGLLPRLRLLGLAATVIIEVPYAFFENFYLGRDPLDLLPEAVNLLLSLFAFVKFAIELAVGSTSELG